MDFCMVLYLMKGNLGKQTENDLASNFTWGFSKVILK